MKHKKMIMEKQHFKQQQNLGCSSRINVQIDRLLGILILKI